MLTHRAQHEPRPGGRGHSAPRCRVTMLGATGTLWPRPLWS